MTIRLTHRQRGQGIADAVITLDEAAWRQASEAERMALIDHELVHLTIAKDKDGLAKSDDLGRPKLKMRLHDVQVGWFLDVARRHGNAAPEVQAIRAARETYGQRLFGWAAESEGDDVDEANSADAA